MVLVSSSNIIALTIIFENEPFCIQFLIIILSHISNAVLSILLNLQNRIRFIRPTRHSRTWRKYVFNVCKFRENEIDFFPFRDVRCRIKPHICYGMAVLVACITVAIQLLIWNMPFEIKSITIWMRAMKSKKNTCLWPFIYFWNDLVVGTFAGWISPINRWQLIKTSDIQIISNILLFAIRPDFRFHGKQTDWDGDQTNFIR